jgi:phosphate transport system protein
MTKYFDKELENIKKRILSQGAMVEDRVQMAIKAIESKDPEIAASIIKIDYEINEMEIEIEEECLKVLALHQPVAVDLRFIIAVIKINNDLERIGDQAVNIAERVQSISKGEPFNFDYDYSQMAEKAAAMLKDSLDALVNFDLDLAFKVVLKDDEVDNIKLEAYGEIRNAIQQQPEHVGSLINLYLIARHLERIADHATNIAEEVIYMIEGEIIRHGGY